MDGAHRGREHRGWGLAPTWGWSSVPIGAAQVHTHTASQLQRCHRFAAELNILDGATLISHGAEPSWTVTSSVQDAAFRTLQSRRRTPSSTTSPP